LYKKHLQCTEIYHCLKSDYHSTQFVQKTPWQCDAVLEEFESLLEKTSAFVGRFLASSVLTTDYQEFKEAKQKGLPYRE
jgi:hypothetical protein